MGNVLDYQGPTPSPTPPTGRSIYADYFFLMAFVGSVALALISLYGLSDPMYFLETPLSVSRV